MNFITFLLRFIRVIDFTAFFIANFFVWLFFSHILNNASPAVVILASVLSVVVLKTYWVFEGVNYYKNKPKAELPHLWADIGEYKPSTKKFSLFEGILKIHPVTFVAITVKLFVINLIYESFPVYLIWLGCLGGSYLLFGIMGSVPFTLTQTFFEVVAAIGIVLGVFQFYLKRHEEKIASKISVYQVAIKKVVSQETSFENFYTFLLDIESGKDLRKWIDKKIDSKVQFMEMLKMVSGDKKATNTFIKMFKRPDISPIFNIQISDISSDRKFELMEASAVIDSKEIMLLEAYRAFFLDGEKIENIVSNIRDVIDIQDFLILCLSNINIITEIIPQLVQKKLRSSIASVYTGNYSLKEGEIPLSAIELRNYVENQVFRRLISDLIERSDLDTFNKDSNEKGDI